MTVDEENRKQISEWPFVAVVISGMVSLVAVIKIIVDAIAGC